MGRIYLILIIAMGLAGAIAGRMGAGGVNASQSGASTESPSVEAESTSSFAHSAIAGELVLERRGDGHFYADVEVNGVPIEMLVDTGASSVALSAEDARRAGIATTIGMNEVVGKGAGGAIQGEMVTVERMRLAGVEQSGVQAAVLKGGSMSLLGQSFLRDFASVEIRGDRMHLR
jgi:aspartyl protease family protein